MKKYFYSLEYVPDLKKKLWHVRERVYVHSVCVGAFEEEELAITYTNYLNNERTINTI